MYLQGKVVNTELNVIQGLSSVQGIGEPKAKWICNLCHIHYKLKIGELNTIQQIQIKKIVAEMTVGFKLAKQKESDILNLINKKTYRGFKHIHGQPVRGQNNKNNAKTRKKHKNSQIHLIGRSYFKTLNKFQYINSLRGIVTKTSHGHFKIKNNNKKKGGKKK